ncbi:hypothetical protein MST16_09090 [Acinetobacter sp. YH16040_T]|uniref:hypothetical protein n=1 Tax=unclassified Acinetobacter TaxID=196816 RepID=UPI0015D0FA6C|nr:MULTISPECIES: hypothetical protein [unclassified Acinetobacter]UUS56283.1 hypothetical protein MST16_09090 [Acinetobacter sp. YH16040_T]
MNAATQSSLRTQLCQALIAAGKTDAKSIIGEVTTLEQFIFGEYKTAGSHDGMVEEPKVILAETQKAPAEEKQTEAVKKVAIEDEAQTATFDDVKAALMQVAKKSRSELQDILNHFGAANLSAIQEKDFSAVVSMADSILETANG